MYGESVGSCDPDEGGMSRKDPDETWEDARSPDVRGEGTGVREGEY